MNALLRYSLILLLIFGLILIRAFEDSLFYDPFLAFFKSDFNNANTPHYNDFKLLTNHLFRFGLNSLLSLSIIYLLFLKKSYIQFSAIVLLVGFIFSLIGYWYCLKSDFYLGYNVGFTIRRVLIQPIILLILIPALFFHHKKSSLA